MHKASPYIPECTTPTSCISCIHVHILIILSNAHFHVWSVLYAQPSTHTECWTNTLPHCTALQECPPPSPLSLQNKHQLAPDKTEAKGGHIRIAMCFEWNLAIARFPPQSVSGPTDIRDVKITHTHNIPQASHTDVTQSALDFTFAIKAKDGLALLNKCVATGTPYVCTRVAQPMICFTIT
jgi:hypothetical protein